MPGRILVVDDIATNRAILKAKLCARYYDVIEATDGAQALGLRQRQHLVRDHAEEDHHDGCEHGGPE